jgi:catechol 2,3-dioxygenase-like lactoylglutathione lyase family enzyme
VLQHVTLEVRADDVGRFAVLLDAIGFESVEVPTSLGDGYRWFERNGTQVHLALVDDPDVPAVGHAAFLVQPLAPAVDRLEAAGFEFSERRRHWGARRVVVTAPAGHRVELMESPPGQAAREA